MSNELRDLSNPLKFMAWSITKAIQHPHSEIEYYYCHVCEVRMDKNIGLCPSCGRQIGNSPQRETRSPVPWQASVILIILGISALTIGECMDINALDRVGDALIFLPLGNLFGMSLRK